MTGLAALEEVIDISGIAPRIEAMLPAGARGRQLSIRTLMAGMCLAQADGRPAHLTRVRQALVSLPEDDQRRLGVLTDRKGGPHLLTYRQTGYTFGLAARALARDEPDGLPSGRLQHVCDDLLEASVPEGFKDASASLAVDRTDLESFSRPPPHGTRDCADPEASWGHRRNNLLRSQDELSCGYYFSAGTMEREEDGAELPELARRMTVCSCRHDPARALVPVLTAMPGDGIPPGDILTTPATPTATRTPGRSRRAGPGRSWYRTCTPAIADRRAHTKAPSSQTGTCTAPRHPAGCRSSDRPPAPPRKNRPPATTARPPSWPATSSAASPPATPTATTACSARPPRARSAARSGPPP